MNGQSEHDQYPHYSMIIEWSEEDKVYLATIPELGPHHTHGKTYAEAARQGQDLLETLVDDYVSDGQPLPEPQVFSYQKWHGDESLTDGEAQVAELAHH